MMNIRSTILYFSVLMLFAISCERPNNPDFKVNHSAKTPLLAAKKFEFLGGADAIIDTTSEDFDSLFAVNEGDRLVSLSKEQDIDLGSFDDAVPEIDSDPNVISSQIGEINGEEGDENTATVGNFQPDFNGSGSASFQEITGFSPPGNGQPVGQNGTGSGQTRISLDPETFVSATIVSGGIEVTFTNNMGFDIANLDAQLYSNTDGVEQQVGSEITNNSTLQQGSSFTDVITFNQGDQLEVDLEVQVNISWNNQTYQEPADGNPSLDVNTQNDDMVVSQATAGIPAQELTPNTPDIQMADPDFQYAVLTENIAQGTLNQLDLEVTNNTELPLTSADRSSTPGMTLRNSNGDVIDSKQFIQIEGEPNATQLEPGETGTVRFDLSTERLTRTLNYTLDLGTAGSEGQAAQVSADDIVLTESQTTDLEVEIARTKLDSETIETDDFVGLDDEEFRFTKQDHYVRLDGGTLVIDSLVNNLDANIQNMDIKVTDLFTPEGDTLKITFEGSSNRPEDYRYRRIEANEKADDRAPIEIDLTNFSIKALNNEIDYELRGSTEETSGAVDISSSDEVNSKLQINNLEVAEAVGVVSQKEIMLNDDEGDNEILDLYNDNEAEVQDFEDLEEISGRIGETKFFNTSMDLLYDINLGVPARLYVVIVGNNGDGKEVYLKPNQGGEYEVDNTNTNFIQGLQVNGQQVSRDRVLELPVEPSDEMGTTYSGAIPFDADNSNVDEFLSNFPTEIRFIGKAVANPEDSEGFVVTPIDFTSSIGFEIPIQLANEEGSEVLKDTLEVDLSDLPNYEDSEDSDVKSKMQESSLRIKYSNRLPLQMDVNMKFLDERDSVLTEVPLPSEDDISLDAPTIDDDSRFANTPFDGEMKINLTNKQAELLYKTRNIRLGGYFVTPSGTGGSHRVKIRSDDFIELSIFGDFKIETEVKK